VGVAVCIFDFSLYKAYVLGFTEEGFGCSV
jgi:hypothetical protein